jgi:hypothetical protein
MASSSIWLSSLRTFESFRYNFINPRLRVWWECAGRRCSKSVTRGEGEWERWSSYWGSIESYNCPMLLVRWTMLRRRKLEVGWFELHWCPYRSGPAAGHSILRLGSTNASSSLRLKEGDLDEGFGNRSGDNIKFSASGWTWFVRY